MEFAINRLSPPTNGLGWSVEGSANGLRPMPSGSVELGLSSSSSSPSGLPSSSSTLLGGGSATTSLKNSLPPTLGAWSSSMERGGPLYYSYPTHAISINEPIQWNSAAPSTSTSTSTTTTKYQPGLDSLFTDMHLSPLEVSSGAAAHLMLHAAPPAHLRRPTLPLAGDWNHFSSGLRSSSSLPTEAYSVLSTTPSRTLPPLLEPVPNFLRSDSGGENATIRSENRLVSFQLPQSMEVSAPAPGSGLPDYSFRPPIRPFPHKADGVCHSSVNYLRCTADGGRRVGQRRSYFLGLPAPPRQTFSLLRRPPRDISCPRYSLPQSFGLQTVNPPLL